VIGGALDLAAGIGANILGAGAAALDVAGDLAGAVVGGGLGLLGGALGFGAGLVGGAADLALGAAGAALSVGADLVGNLFAGVRIGAQGTWDLAGLLARDGLRSASGSISLGGLTISNELRLSLIQRGWFVLNGKLFDNEGFEISLQTGARLGGRLELNIEGGFAGAANLAGAIAGDALRLAGGALRIGGKVLDNAARLRLVGDGAFLVGGKLYNRAGLQIDLDGRIIGGALDLAAGVGLSILGAGAGALDVAGELALAGGALAAGVADAAVGAGLGLIGGGLGLLGGAAKGALGLGAAAVGAAGAAAGGAVGLGLGVLGAGLDLGLDVAGGVIGGLAAGAAGSFDLAASIAGDALRLGGAGLQIAGQVIDDVTRRRLIANGSFVLGGKLFNSGGFEIDISGRVVGPQLRLGASIEGGLSGAIGLAGAMAGDALRTGAAGIEIAGQLIDAATRQRLIASGSFVVNGQLYNRQGLRISLDGRLLGGALDLAAGVGAGILGLGGAALGAAGQAAATGVGVLAGAAAASAQTSLELADAALRVAAGVFDGTRGAIAVALDAGIDLAAFIAGDALRSSGGAIQIGVNGPIMSNARRLELIAQGAFIANGKIFNAQGFQIDISGRALGGTMNLQVDLAAALKANASLRLGGSGSANFRLGTGELSFSLA